MDARVHSIHLVAEPGGPPHEVTEVRAVPGRGLEGDRYFEGTGTWADHPAGDRELTLIEREAVDAVGHEQGIEIAYGDTRRNIVTEGVALNHLVGATFRIGEVTARGKRLCEPCGHLESLTAPGARKALIHRGGLRADILTDGVIRRGDPVTAD